MKLAGSVTGRSQVHPRNFGLLPSPEELAYVRERVRRFLGVFRREDGDEESGGNSGPGGGSIGGPGSDNSGPGSAQPSNVGGDDCEDDDDDECTTRSTSTTSTTSSSSSTTSTPPPQVTTTAAPPPPPPPPVAVSTTTPLSFTPTTASPTAQQDQTPTLFPTTVTSRTASSSESRSSSSSQSFVATILNPRPTTTVSPSSRNTAISTTTLGVRPDSSSAAQGISSNKVSTGSQVGIIVGIIVGVLFAVVGIFFVVKRGRQRRRSRSIIDSTRAPTPSTRGPMSEAPRSSDGFFVDIEQTQSQNLASSNRQTSSSNQSATIDTGEVFGSLTPMPAKPVVIASSGLSSNPVTGTIVQADGSVKTIIKPLPSMISKAKEIMISPRKPVPKVQTTDLFIEEKRGEILPGEWPDKLNKDLPPLAFDMVGRGEDGKAEKKKTLLLEHKPGGRWSDPFTVAWRGSGEADEGGTRWKSALSWVKDQNGRLDGPDSTKEKAVGKKSRLSLA